MRCPSCNRANMLTEKICRYCGTALQEVVDQNQLPTVGESTGPVVSVADNSTETTTSLSSSHNKPDGQLFGRLFKWLLMGWGAFWILAWSAANFKPALELAVAVLFAVSAALISAVVYSGIKEIFKPSAGSNRRAESMESEISALRQKVDELSRKSED